MSILIASSPRDLSSFSLKQMQDAPALYRSKDYSIGQRIIIAVAAALATLGTLFIGLAIEEVCDLWKIAISGSIEKKYHAYVPNNLLIPPAAQPPSVPQQIVAPPQVSIVIAPPPPGLAVAPQQPSPSTVVAQTQPSPQENVSSTTIIAPMVALNAFRKKLIDIIGLLPMGSLYSQNDCEAQIKALSTADLTKLFQIFNECEQSLNTGNSCDYLTITPTFSMFLVEIVAESKSSHCLLGSRKVEIPLETGIWSQIVKCICADKGWNPGPVSSEDLSFVYSR